MRASAKPSTARVVDFRFGSKADIGLAPVDVRSTPKSGHQRSEYRCPLCAKSRHRELGAHGCSERVAKANESCASLATASGVNPSAFAISAAGADMPKRSMPKITPLSPTQRDQPKVAAASMDMRAVTLGGSTSSRYDCGCLAKSVQHGMETTRVSMPCASSSFLVSSASETSDPVAIKTRSGDPVASAIT